MNNNKNLFDQFADWATALTGSAGAFIGASLLVLIWAFTGPIFKFSETWQMVINTGTTIVTFLMVFLIQKAQNKDSKAIQIKLDELIAAHEKASNRIVDIEDLTEKEGGGYSLNGSYSDNESKQEQDDEDQQIEDFTLADETRREINEKDLTIE